MNDDPRVVVFDEDGVTFRRWGVLIPILVCFLLGYAAGRLS